MKKKLFLMKKKSLPNNELIHVEFVTKCRKLKFFELIFKITEDKVFIFQRTDLLNDKNVYTVYLYTVLYMK